MPLFSTASPPCHGGHLAFLENVGTPGDGVDSVAAPTTSMWGRGEMMMGLVRPLPSKFGKCPCKHNNTVLEDF